MSIETFILDNLAWLRRKARIFCRDEFEAEDLVSETIEKLLLSQARFDNTRNFRPWALTIMKNAYITIYNRRKCIPFVGLVDECEPVSEFFADSDIEVSQILSAIRECSRKSVSIECVVLYAKGYSYDEISRMLHIPIGTVMSRISNGRKMLRDALAD